MCFKVTVCQDAEAIRDVYIPSVDKVKAAVEVRKHQGHFGVIYYTGFFNLFDVYP